MSTHTKNFADKTVPDSIPRTTTKGPLLWGRRFDARHKFQLRHKNARENFHYTNATATGQDRLRCELHHTH